MNETTKTKAINLEDLQLSVQDIYNRGGFGNVGTCNTAAATAAKTVTLGTIFSLSTGCVLLIKFTNGIESENPTLAITHTTLAGTTVTEDAKPIYLNGAALEANIIPAGASIILRYNGAQFDIVGDGGQASDAYTKAQTDTLLNAKVDKVTGKELSTNDYTDNDKDKLDDLPSASEPAASGGTNLSLVTTGEKYTWNHKQDAITDMKQLGCGYITCSTPGGTQAKVASLQGFTLLTGSHITVYFIYGFTTTGSTLNINETGAKPIYLYGSPIAPHKVHDHCVLSMVYDGTQYDVTSILYMGESLVIGAVDLDLPSGILWADKNVGAATPEASGLYFSWGNVQGHTADSGYNYGTSNGKPYASTPGAALTGDIAVGDTYDMARHNMNAPWRLPTKEDYQELYDNCDNIYIEENGVKGRRFTSRVNGNSIFIPAVGSFHGTGRNDYNNGGYYWTSSLRNSNEGHKFYFSPTNVEPQSWNDRFGGLPVRAVQ